MLPGGFKKDSRVWLHKNAHIYPKHNVPMGIQRVGSDDPYEQFHEDTLYNQPYLITDENGRVFKKDSRTWLHKSSAKKAAKKVNDQPIRLSTPGVKLSWRQIRTIPDIKLSNEIMCEGLFRTRSSTEMVRTQTGANKLKKKKRTAGNYTDTVFSPTLDARSVKEIPGKGSFTKQSGASFPDMVISRRGSCEVAAYTSDYCIVGKPSSPSRTFPTSNSASEIEDEADDTAEGYPSRTNSVYEKRDITTDYPLCCVSDGGCTGVSSKNTSLELSKDGLQELIKVEHRRRSERLSKRGLGELPLEVSPQSNSSDSNLGLDATYCLSEEYVSVKVPFQASDKNSATHDSTHVCTSDLDTPTEPKAIHGGVLRST
ncbi:uncharacterized protein LOC106063282 isoform X2 [Biomphalaria glabrata]|uniref:Uncharacterized protein LOC106063282 isoform X2 n=1 Tax=Biomphalaria glabrata TaxID=6526 RepID=A0A9U8E883_BIOGL|nr:uncharacterized protein LOC106063282 isoform X2 [Biomphalaria glabrata]